MGSQLSCCRCDRHRRRNRYVFEDAREHFEFEYFHKGGRRKGKGNPKLQQQKEEESFDFAEDNFYETIEYDYPPLDTCQENYYEEIGTNVRSNETRFLRGTLV
jgi:hypothetical protein